MTVALIILAWFFLPTLAVCLICCVLSALRIKPPKPRSNRTWHATRDW